MGMWPTATLTYGYDIANIPDDWHEDDGPEENAGRLLAEAGFPEMSVVQHRDTEQHRLVAVYLSASGYADRETADDLTVSAVTGRRLRQAAEALGLDLGDGKPHWLLTGKFD